MDTREQGERLCRRQGWRAHLWFWGEGRAPSEHTLARGTQGSLGAETTFYSTMNHKPSPWHSGKRSDQRHSCPGCWSEGEASLRGQEWGHPQRQGRRQNTAWEVRLPGAGEGVGRFSSERIPATPAPGWGRALCCLGAAAQATSRVTALKQRGGSGCTDEIWELAADQVLK